MVVNTGNVSELMRCEYLEEMVVLSDCTISVEENCVNTFVQTILDYGCYNIWNPHTKTNRMKN